MHRYLMLLLFAGLLSSCNHSGGEAEFAQSDKMMSMEMPRTAEAPLPPGEQDAAIEPKIILTASMRCRVKDLERSTQSVRQSVEGMKGSVTQMNWVHSQSSIENMLTIRIPSDKLDTLLERISRKPRMSITATCNPKMSRRNTWTSKPACAPKRGPRPLYRHPAQ
ncbi:MAG: DUF4349 domain-containing protein [Haliscomenobacter sp.]|nr:DUF4349 domain-containing protein [Haliscomenobacter sp.]